jgi:acyl-CoA synthetase (AMP-forming)/AMP-acid ligase II
MQYNLADLFESVADAVPERIALVCGDTRASYAELDARANRLAHALAARGIGPADHVGLQLRNSREYVEGMLACFKLRAVPINVNFRYVEDELRYLYDDADLRAVIFHREFGPRVAVARGAVSKLATLVVVEDGAAAGETPGDALRYEEILAAASPARGFAPRSPDDLYVIYTGGTTGMPKGVMWRHEDAFYSCLFGGNPMGPLPSRPEEVAERAKARPAIAMMSAAPLIHGAAQLGTLIAFMQGSTTVLHPRFDPAEIWRVIERERVLTLSLVGDAMARPLAEALHEPEASYDLSCLMILSSAGALLSPAVKEQLKAKLPKLAILDNFGSSETGGQGMDAGGVAPEGGIRFRMNDNTAVLDDDLRPIEPGSGRVGRIALRRRIPLGYYKDPEKTARTFLTVNGERWVLPGDLARPDADGTVTVFGRGATCINTGGEKVFPEEVEGVLKSHPDVFDAIVVGVPDERFGQRVAALVQPRPGRAAGAEALVAHCRAHLAGYKVPREVHAVETIVRSPSGKPDYPWARAVALERRGAGAASGG